MNKTFNGHLQAATPQAKLTTNIFGGFAEEGPAVTKFTQDAGSCYDMRKNNENGVAAQQKVIQVIKNPEKIANRLVDKIQEFWKKHYVNLDKKGRFKEENLSLIVIKLEEFDKYFD